MISPSRASMSPVAMQARASALSIIRLVGAISLVLGWSWLRAPAAPAAHLGGRGDDILAELGLRFCGMVELPTVPGGTGSSTSLNSVFIKV